MGCCLNSGIDRPRKPTQPQLTTKTSTSLLSIRSSTGQFFQKANFIKFFYGSLLEKYTIVKEIGHGKFGNVYLAWQKSTQLDRAIKSVSKSKVIPQTAHEIEILRQLDHPNIVKVIEVIEQPSILHIVMELCTGGELFDRIVKSKKLTEGVAAKYMEDLIQALSYCHSNGVAHRDLKPENIMFPNEESSDLKICDFGCAILMDSNKIIDKPVGTPYYVAPEVLSGEYNEKCDIWSCGVILYVMLSGRPPFHSKSKRDLLKLVQSGPLEFPERHWNCISRDAIDLIKHMIDRDVNRRYGTKEVLEHPWMSLAKEQLDIPLANQALNNLAGFQSQYRLQKATLFYISSQLVTYKETQSLAKSFKQLDVNNDGRLSKDEVINGFSQIEIKIPIQIDELMERCDIDGNGFIDYNEFITVTLNWEQSLSKQRLLAAFESYDKDHSGKITVNELKWLLDDGDEDTDYIWKEILEEVDLNGDGEIDFLEFEKMMTAMLKEKHFSNN
ncbi:CDPK1_15 [Blepharisma stoltei]|uniref:non-specific serine/threonine protein kinase n=1 Tax=Blepharisma stoltei TaxID=1481888 RepID=A0AAU9IKY6_9CILI|nr:unnamed protein product [Blepharisma stoltei]